jgi:hypothetical protein
MGMKMSAAHSAEEPCGLSATAPQGRNKARL